MDQRPLDEVFLSHAGDIEQAAEALRSIVRDLRNLPASPDVDGAALQHPYRACKKFYAKLKTVENLLNEAERLVLEMQFNAYWKGKLRRQYDLSSYEKKKEVVKELNEDLRRYEVMVRHPDTGEPCLVLAVGSPDGKGRYVLSDRRTKKRTHTSSTLLELIPFRFVEEPRRRESFLEKGEGPDKADADNDKSG